MNVVSLTLRTWLRYVVPLTLLAVLAHAPLLYLAWKAEAPVDVLSARALLRRGWLLAIAACAVQLWVVAAVAPAVRAVATKTPLSQWRCTVTGLRSLARGFIPWLVAMIAVLLGGLALVAPGVLLLVLVSMTGASDRLGSPPAIPIEDSIAVARRALPRVALVVGAIIVVSMALTYAVHVAYVPAVGKKVALSKLVPVRTFVRTAMLALVAFAPLAACALGAMYSRAQRR